jgi:glutamate racemase
VRVTKSGRIGIIGTEATIASKAYETLIEREAERQSKTCTTVSVACPLFVPLAEEGWTDHAATRMIAEEYLRDVKSQNVDTLILGCTHYPVLTNIIQGVMGPTVTLVNSGAVAAKQVIGLLGSNRSQSTAPQEPTVLVSDVPRKFQKIGERFLGRRLPEAHQVVWKESWVIRREPIGGGET